MPATIRCGMARDVRGCDPSIGGRYSVLSPFGLVPAAAAGIDLARFLDSAVSMVRSCGAHVPPHENPGVQLGLVMGIAGQQGRDKVTVLSSKRVADFGAWAEQLIAESTGKDGSAKGSSEVVKIERKSLDSSLFKAPAGYKKYDMPDFFAAVGQLPNQAVLPPFVASVGTNPADLVEYVIAVHDPFTHPSYRIVAEYPEGRLYRVVR